MVNPQRIGTKAAAHYKFVIAPKESRTIRLRLSKIDPPSLSSGAAGKQKRKGDPFADFDETFLQRTVEADEFYGEHAPSSLSDEHRAIQRQALAGMLWNKQFYHYIVEQWLDGDPGQPPPPPEPPRGTQR